MSPAIWQCGKAALSTAASATNLASQCQLLAVMNMGGVSTDLSCLWPVMAFYFSQTD